MQNSTPCPCGRPGTLTECCVPYVTGELSAPDPESLMRSRYTAFSLGTPEAVEYLFTTHHPEYRSPDLREGLSMSIASVDAWVRLRVLHAEANGERGVVEFIATYRVGQEQKELHERSEFARVGGRWFYTEGAVLDR